jgi:hypothetical protein
MKLKNKNKKSIKKERKKTVQSRDLQRVSTMR